MGSRILERVENKVSYNVRENNVSRTYVRKDGQINQTTLKRSCSQWFIF